MESGIVQDLGCNVGITKDAIRCLILCCVNGQIVPMFQKIIVQLKNRELCFQWCSIKSQNLLIFQWKEFYFGTSVLLSCCVSSCLCAGGEQQNCL